MTIRLDGGDAVFGHFSLYFSSSHFFDNCFVFAGFST